MKTAANCSQHVEHIVPEIGPFFEQMVEESEEIRLTARQALGRFMAIYNNLTLSQLRAEVTAMMWKKGL